MSPDSTAITAPSLADTSIYVKEHMISDVNENADPYQDLQIIKRLTKGKFPVYLTSSKFKNETYAMKVFKDADKCYENEIRFASLSHPNILSIVHNEKERTLVQKGLFMRLTYVLLEYAPHGNFFDFTTKHKNEMDDKLIRTYFRQLIEGLEYLHGIGVAHLDLNPENLQIDANFNLKISNFHLAYVASDDSIINRGITYYHSPEFANSLCLNIELDQISAVDIYSAGILLFILKSGGVPHTENHMIRGVNLRDLMHENHPEFWSQHCKIQGKGKNFFDNNFKDLFYKMINPNPKQRLSIKAIKQSEWYNGPVYSSQELSIKMKKILGC